MLAMTPLTTSISGSFVPDFSAQVYLRFGGEGDTGVEIDRDEALGLIVASKRPDGFGRKGVDTLRALIQGLAEEREGACKFLVFDLSGAEGDYGPPEAFAELLAAVADLIVSVPIVTVAWARGRVAGHDLELAFACSVIAGEPQARFCFDLDLVDSLRTYSVFAHKIGFVRAERIMESGAELDCDKMSELMLLSAVPASDERAGIRDFVRARARRHNASCGIYRAQRLAMPAL